MRFSRLRQRQRVEICPVCRSDFVHPVRWGEADQDHWWMRLRCGACGHRYRAVVCDEAATEFDAKLDRDQFLIASDADRLHWEWRSAEVDAFAAALEHDLITAYDFAYSGNNPSADE